jgi:thioesterase domain-containing protein/acyl carrier protein
LVALSHRAILFDIGRQTNDLYLGPDDRFDSLFSFAFSASLATTFGALLNGAELHCYDPRHDLTALARWLGERRITVSTMTVSMLRHICLLGCPATTFSNMRLLSVGGEELHRADVEAFRAGFPSSCVLQNAMAATETRTYAQYFVPRSGPVESPVPIGWPVAGKDVQLLDERGSIVPEGKEGEIAVRSRYLADGYANDRQQTAMKFQTQPDGTVLYRTGDRGMFRGDGCLLFLGRTDSQAKIRGHRVELDHIAQVIGLHPHVRTSVVVTCSDSAGNDRLVAYLMARPNYLITETHVRDFLRDRLPEYAVPSAIVFLPELPLNANFKVDRRRLPPPLLPTREEGAPTDGQTIEILRDIWKEVLQRLDITDDESFAELGGDSLSTVRMLVAIHERLHRDLPPDSLQRFPTLKLLADYVKSTVRDDAIPDSVSIFQSGGTGCPFFFVAGLGGSTSDYEHLATRIDSRHPAYGLNARSRFDAISGVSVESIAANHVAEIERIVAPSRKLVLVGHSFGGTIAFEIARQLRKKGFVDVLPIVIDMPAINAAPRTTRQKVLDVLRNLPAWTAHEVAHFRLPGSLLRGYGNLRRMVRALSGLPTADKFDPHIYFGRRSLPQAYQAFLTSMYLAMLAYVPGRYEGRMILLRTKIPTLTRRSDITMGWQAVAAGGVEVHSIPGGHKDCVSERHGSGLISALLRCAATFESGERTPV